MTTETDTRGLGRGMIAVAWLLVLGLLWYVFDGYLDRRDNPNRGLEVRTGTGAEELVLRRNRLGHYVVPGTINGRPVTFMLDTGATLVSVPAHLGSALGLAPGTRYQVSTANGDISVRATRVDELGLGPFRLSNVAAHLNPGMQTDEILLGMSVLKHLEFTQRADVLILRAPSH